jgi:hypothetical protein
MILYIRMEMWLAIREITALKGLSILIRMLTLFSRKVHKNGTILLLISDVGISVIFMFQKILVG